MKPKTQFHYRVTEFLTVLGSPESSFSEEYNYSGNLKENRKTALAFALDRQKGIEKRGHYRDIKLAKPPAIEGAAYSVSVELVETYDGWEFTYNVYGEDLETTKETLSIEQRIGAI